MKFILQFFFMAERTPPNQVAALPINADREKLSHHPEGFRNKQHVPTVNGEGGLQSPGKSPYPMKTLLVHFGASVIWWQKNKIHLNTMVPESVEVQSGNHATGQGNRTGHRIGYLSA